MKPLDVDLDGILESLGRFGKYQLKLSLWTFIPIVLCSLHASNYIFTAPEVSYRCRIPECEGGDSAFEPSWLANAVPVGDKCNRYKSANQTRLGLFSKNEQQCPANLFDKNQKVSCEEYLFKDDDTFIEEMDIPCESWKRTLIGTMHSVGTLLALPLIGAFSDKFGRKHAMIISSIIDGILGIVKSLSVNYAMFITMEIVEPTFGSGVYSSAYILALEILTPSTRVAGGSLVNIYFGTGQVLMGFFAWLFPYWRTYLQIIYAPCLLIFVYYWISDESIRWLISKFRYQEALDIVNKIAKTNKKTPSEKSLESLRFNLENAEKIQASANSVSKDDEDKIDPAWKQVIRSKILILRVFKVSVWWITCTFCFYGLSINSAILPGDQYVNFIISAAVEIPSHILAYYGFTYFGRKKSLLTAFLLGGISLLSFAFIPSDLNWLALLAYFVGKLFVTMAFNGVYLYTSELFPTQLRHSLLAMCSMLGRIGSILAPQTPLLASILPELPSYLFAGTCLISAALMLNSPETLNMRLPDTVEEAENISSSKKNILQDLS